MLKSHYTPDLLEAGLDEVGRGCLSGPVVAAAVVFPKGYQNKVLNDSKKLTKKTRETLPEQIKKDALYWSIQEVSETKIDEINILNASFLAMHKCIDVLEQQPDFLLVDGNRFTPYKDIPHECIIKGDGKYLSIAAASILAKTYRDDCMLKLHGEYPQYGWDKNKGYPTKAHRAAIVQHGSTTYHRQSFRLTPTEEQKKLF